MGPPCLCAAERKCPSVRVFQPRGGGETLSDAIVERRPSPPFVLSPLLSHPAMARAIVNQAKRFASRIHRLTSIIPRQGRLRHQPATPSVERPEVTSRVSSSGSSTLRPAQVASTSSREEGRRVSVPPSIASCAPRPKIFVVVHRRPARVRAGRQQRLLRRMAALAVHNAQSRSRVRPRAVRQTSLRLSASSRDIAGS